MNIVEEIFARNEPHALALVERESLYSFGELDELSSQVATELERHLPSIDGRCLRIGLRCPDSAAYVAFSLGLLRAGGCLTPAPLEMSEAELLDMFAKTRLDFILWADWQESDFPDLAKFCSPISVLKYLEKDLTLLRVGNLAKMSNRLGKFSEVDFAAINPAFIRFSSGTTGESKGVVLSHETIEQRILAANEGLRIGSSDRILWVLPMAHHFVVSIVLYLYHGALTLVKSANFASEFEALANLREFDGGRHGVLDLSPSIVYASPFHYMLLCASDLNFRWSSLRLAIATSFALNEEVAHRFFKKFKLPITQALGIIEVGLPIINLDINKSRNLRKYAAVGKALPDYKLGKINQSDDVAGANADSLSELRISGPGIFDAYLEPWRTRKQVLQNGFFVTGDLALADGDGDIFIKGRRGSIINCGGMKFFPEEVEEVLRSHPKVLDARVLGTEHAATGMAPVAEVRPRDLANPPTARELAAHCRLSLSAHKAPVSYKFVAKIAKTHSGKTMRRKTKMNV